MNTKKSQKGGGFIVVQVIMQFFAAIVMIIFNLAKELVLGFMGYDGQCGGAASGVAGEVRRKVVKYIVCFLRFCFFTAFIFMMFILGGPTILMVCIIYGYFMLYRSIKEFDKGYAKTLT